MAFTPANIPIEIWVGNHETIIRRFKAKDEAGEVAPINLSDMDVYFTVFNGEDKLIEKSTVASNVTIDGPGNSQLTVTLDPEETRDIAAVYNGGYKPTYEIEIRDGVSEATWVYGKITLRGGKNEDA